MVGLWTAFAVAASHLAPHWSAFSDPYADNDLDWFSWGQMLLLIAAAAALGLCYGALQNLTLIVAFAAVGRQQLPTASAVWNIGFDTGTASGAVLAGVLATAYSFPVSLATMAAFCLFIAVLAVIVPSLGQTTRR
jgi:predicted MFS family arabinose efflux permease